VLLVVAPRFAHSAGECKALFAERLLLGEPFAVTAKVALQMRSADLPRAGVQVLVAEPSVRDDNPRAGADQLVELLAVAVLGDLEDRRAGAGRGPQRTTVTRGPPAGLIDMPHALGQNQLEQSSQYVRG
jgi:hypothetical protein